MRELRKTTYTFLLFISVLFIAAVMFPAAAVSAESVTDSKGFVIETDSNGHTALTGYTGSGGNIVIPKNVEYISPNAFAGNETITGVIVSADSELKFIGYQAFYNCTSLEKAVIKNDLHSIGEKAFMYCTALRKVSFYGSVENGIYPYTFSDCTSLKQVEFTDSSAVVGKIDTGAFMDCYSLTSINLPSGTGEIGSLAFANCVSLTKLTVPANTAIKGGGAFGYIYGFKNRSDWYDSFSDVSIEPYMLPADGKNSLFYDYAFSASAKGAESRAAKYKEYSILTDNKYIVPLKIAQKPPVMIVSKGSDAHKWAEDNGVKFMLDTDSAAKLDAPKNIKSQAKKDSISLKWDKVSGADGYTVYILNEDSGEYEKYDNVQTETVTVTGLESSTVYKFSVAAYKKNGSSYIIGRKAGGISVSTKK